MNKEIKYEVKLHSYQIADTGDYDGCHEITNGKVSIITKDDGDDIEERLTDICNVLNKTEIDFYFDDSDKYIVEALTKENSHLYKLLEQHGINPYEETTAPSVSDNPNNERSCPCLYLKEPCHPMCTCVHGESSIGCAYCCKYGSIEQRTKRAEILANKLSVSDKQGEESAANPFKFYVNTFAISVENLKGSPDAEIKKDFMVKGNMGILANSLINMMEQHPAIEKLLCIVVQNFLTRQESEYENKN